MPDESRPVRRWIVRGRVQGVSYRWFALRAARELGVAGWVRNRSDGTVEAWVEGPSAAVEELRRRLRRGPPLARVDDVEEEIPSEAARFDGFEIRH